MAKRKPDPEPSQRFLAGKDEFVLRDADGNVIYGKELAARVEAGEKAETEKAKRAKAKKS